MLADLLKVIGLYLGFLVALVAILKLVFSFSKRHLSFIFTIKPLIIAALLANLFSILLFKTFLTSGFYWGDIPDDYFILRTTIVVFPIICVALVLGWTLKKQLRRANKINGT